MKKIAPGLWVPHSERGHKMLFLEGENEIPRIAFMDFLTIFHFCPFLTTSAKNNQRTILFAEFKQR